MMMTNRVEAKTGNSGAIATAFVSLFFVLLMLPLVLTPCMPNESTAEKRDLAPWPSLVTEEGSPNAAVLSEAGAWFEDHFAGRAQLVDLDATLKESLFMTSATDNVIVGRDGWLYYAGTLNDYRRTRPLSDRALDNIACNIALIERQLRSEGRGFAFTIAPNKNTLYPEHMPYYELAGSGPSDLERLVPLLEERGVSYVNLVDVLSGADRCLYLKRDSHWSNEGARVGAVAILEMLGHHVEALGGDEVVDSSEHVGDVDLMLHPVWAQGEMQKLWVDSLAWAYVGDATSVEDAHIETVADEPVVSGGVVVYRDSFGNALVPYLASVYERGIFTKMVPYDMSDATLSAARDVIVERAERHLSFFNSDPPYFTAPVLEEIVPEASEDTMSTLTTYENGPYLVVEGDLEQSYADDGTPIYILVDLPDGSTKRYEAFHVGPSLASTADQAGGQEESTPGVTTDWGFRAYVPMQDMGGSVAHGARVVVFHGGVPTVAIEREIERGGAQ